MDGQSLLQRFIVAYQNKDLRSQQHITKYKMPENLKRGFTVKKTEKPEVDPEMGVTLPGAPFASKTGS